MAPVWKTPAGTTTRPPPAAWQASIALRMASVLSAQPTAARPAATRPAARLFDCTARAGADGWNTQRVRIKTAERRRRRHIGASPLFLVCGLTGWADYNRCAARGVARFAQELFILELGGWIVNHRGTEGTEDAQRV